MSTELVDLWPENLAKDVLSPATIMNYQASRLEEKTDGVLRSFVRRKDPEKQIILEFIVEAPAAQNISTELFSVQYSQSRCYPCKVVGPEMHSMLTVEPGLEMGVNYRTAYSQSELLQCIAEILNSGETRSILESFIALSNEVATS